MGGHFLAMCKILASLPLCVVSDITTTEGTLKSYAGCKTLGFFKGKAWDLSRILLLLAFCLSYHEKATKRCTTSFRSCQPSVYRTKNDLNVVIGSSSARYSRKKSDKVELLDDVGPTDYSSIGNKDESALDDTLWEKPSPRGSSQKKSAVSARPPKNLFDDV